MFREKVRLELGDLVRELQLETCRFGSEESEAWRQSLPVLASLLDAETLQPLHLYIRGPGHLDLEYQLPASGAFADAVLLGSQGTTSSAIVLELKHWITRADRPGRARGLVEHRGIQELHPSDQVRGYTEYCRQFHSAVQDYQAKVHGCVLFTRDHVTAPYVAPPNDDLVRDFPIFTLSQDDRAHRLPQYLSSRLTEPNAAFAEAFATGLYRQERGFIRQIARQICDSKSRPFELLDNQRRALSLCEAAVNEIVAEWRAGRTHRKVVVVIGPPGSGKSAVAARLWAEVSLMPAVPDGDLVFVTTSLSQNSNWTDIFEQVGSRGVVRKATAFHPITTPRLGFLRRRYGKRFLENVKEWRKNVDELYARGETPRSGSEDKRNLVSIVDEGHSLTNPERDGGVGQFGFVPSLGPQAYHIIRASMLSIFFLDPKQGFRHRENTTLDDLRSWARELEAGELEIISLEGVQFRCAGSVEFVSWVEGVLSGNSAARNAILASAWHVPDSARKGASGNANVVLLRSKVASGSTYGERVVPSTQLARRTPRARPFDFCIFADPESLEEHLRAKVHDGESARLLSSYSRPWLTRGIANPHSLLPQQQDFCESVSAGGESKTWCRVWNVVPLGSDDYTQFIQAKPGSRMSSDPLAEVGCPYAVRGFDYDYVGVLWLEDLVWRGGEWRLNLEHVHETGLSNLVHRAKAESGLGLTEDILTDKVKQAYRILLTRALKGLYVWVKDPETRDYLSRSLLGDDSSARVVRD